MKKEIKRIGVFQSSKVLALMVMIPFAIVSWTLAIAALFTQEATTAFAFLIAPIAYGFVSFIMYVIIFWFYNVVSRGFGGMTIDLEDYL